MKDICLTKKKTKNYQNKIQYGRRKSNMAIEKKPFLGGPLNARSGVVSVVSSNLSLLLYLQSIKPAMTEFKSDEPAQMAIKRALKFDSKLP